MKAKLLIDGYQPRATAVSNTSGTHSGGTSVRQLAKTTLPTPPKTTSSVQIPKK